MKKLICIMVSMLMANVALGVVVYEEHFDYADEAALDAVWTIDGYSDDFTLNTGVSSDGDGKSALGSNPTGWFHAKHQFGGLGAGAEMSVSVDWLVDTANGMIPKTIEEMGLDGWFSLTCPGASAGNYELNTYGGGYTPLGISLVEGWNTVTVSFDGAGVASFDIDGNTSAVTRVVGNTVGLQYVKFFDPSGGPMAYDNIVIDVIPEPITICLLGLGGLLIRRKR